LDAVPGVLEKMLGECQGAPSRELIRYVPADICTGLRQGMAEGLKKLEDALELARTAATGEPEKKKRRRSSRP
jgi:hypothetical protein